MKALVIAEHDDAARVLSAGARTLADEVAVVTVGSQMPDQGIADAAYHVNVPDGFIADDADYTLAPLSEGIDVVVAEPTRHVKAIVGKLAARQGTAVMTDALSIEDGIATSMYFGGVGQIERRSVHASFYTVNPSIFSSQEPSGSNGASVELEWVAPPRAVKLVSSNPIEKSGIDLTKSKIVVAVGRGFAKEDDIVLARNLAEKIDAGLGCSRPLAEGVNWMPKETYIGVSGLMLAPKVYIAIGISGQMQHMVGCNRSGVVFAINKDENAAVFSQCDYGLIGDLKDILPKLVQSL